MKNRPRILFMGTPDFSVASLGALLMNGHNICAVVTAPDKPSGRGRKLSPGPVKEFAGVSNLKVLQPVNLKESAFLKELEELSPDIIVVVAFRIIPEEVWSVASLGTFNLHASLLPQYRGAAPINHAIINGETETGVTTFLIDSGLDTGKILFREKVNIFPTDNSEYLHERLMRKGAALVVKTVNALVSGTVTPLNQESFISPGEQLKRAPKIFPDDCVIDWKRDSVSLHNFVRGLAPAPAARSYFGNIKGKEAVAFKLFESNPETEEHPLEPGTVVVEGKKGLKVACGKGFLSIITLQLAGRKTVSAGELLQGYDMSGTVALSREMVLQERGR